MACHQEQAAYSVNPTAAKGDGSHQINGWLDRIGGGDHVPDEVLSEALHGINAGQRSESGSEDVLFILLSLSVSPLKLSRPEIRPAVDRV